MCIYRKNNFYYLQRACATHPINLIIGVDREGMYRFGSPGWCAASARL